MKPQPEIPSTSPSGEPNCLSSEALAMALTSRPSHSYSSRHARMRS